MRTRVKICCMLSPEEVRVAVTAGVDALGLVGPMPSGPGIIDDPELIARLAARVPPPVATFLLSSSTEPGRLVEQARGAAVSVLQLVDHLPAAAHRHIRQALPSLRLVQVIHVEGETAVEQAIAAAATVDALLLDSGRPAAPMRELGGTGRPHDWSISRRIVEAVPVPVFLAGGLAPYNVADAIRAVRPFGVDVCTGVRTAGRLDPVKLARLMEAVAACSPAPAKPEATGGQAGAGTGTGQLAS